MKTKRLTAISIVVFSNATFLYTLITYASKTFPYVGHDFSYFIPRLLDHLLYKKINGVLSIQWYTPTFGGGLPVFPNPQDMQFTLPEFLLFFFDPWSAIWISTSIYITAGFIFSFLFFEKVLEFSPYSSALGAIILNINGFIFSQMVVGHLGYQIFPLLPVILFALLHPKYNDINKGIIIAIVVSLNIYSGGFYIIVIFILSLCMATPISIIINPSLLRWNRLSTTLSFSLLFSILISSPKIMAVWAFMRFFPREIRDSYNVNFWEGLYGIFLQLFGTSTILTLQGIFNSRDLLNYITISNKTYGGHYPLFGFEAGISAATILLLPFFASGLILKFKKEQILKTTVLFVMALFGLWLTIEFRLTKGVLYPSLHLLPFLKSLHVNLRYTSAFIFPFSILAAFGFETLCQKLPSETKKGLLFVFLTIVTLFPISTYLWFPPEEVFIFSFDASKVKPIYTRIMEGDTFEIKTISDVSDFESLYLYASSSKPYEPIFGYSLEDFHPYTMTGSVRNINEAYYNITNPASLVFPNENYLTLFERIRTSDTSNFENFINRRKTSWNIPLVQTLLILISSSTILFILIHLSINIFIFCCKRKQING